MKLLPDPDPSVVAVERLERRLEVFRSEALGVHAGPLHCFVWIGVMPGASRNVIFDSCDGSTAAEEAALLVPRR
jgi:hypothetical protein